MDTPPQDTVRSVMTGRVLAVTPDTTLETALRLMTEIRARHLPVMDGEHCVGLLHESSVLWTLWTYGSAGHTAGTDCHRPAPTVGPDDPIATAAARITRGGTDAALVTTNGSIIGIITAADILHRLATQADH
jgi:CBS domain-containing protein